MSGSIVQSLGIITVVWGGQTINVDKTASFSLGGPIAKPVMNGNQISMGIDQVTPCEVQVNFALLKGMSVAKLKSFNGSELQVECDSGQTFTCDSAFITNDPKVKGGAGSNVTVKWNGAPMTEVVAS